jgi:hypothetical protein
VGRRRGARRGAARGAQRAAAEAGARGARPAPPTRSPPAPPLRVVRSLAQPTCGFRRRCRAPWRPGCRWPAGTGPPRCAPDPGARRGASPASHACAGAGPGRSRRAPGPAGASGAAARDGGVCWRGPSGVWAPWWAADRDWGLRRARRVVGGAARRAGASAVPRTRRRGRARPPSRAVAAASPQGVRPSRARRSCCVNYRTSKARGRAVGGPGAGGAAPEAAGRGAPGWRGRAQRRGVGWRFKGR